MNNLLCYWFIYCILWRIADAASSGELDISLQCNQPVEIKFNIELLPEGAKCVEFYSTSVPSVVETYFESDSITGADKPSAFSKFKIKMLFPKFNSDEIQGIILRDDNSIDTPAELDSQMTSLTWGESMDVGSVYIRKWSSMSKVEVSGLYAVSTSNYCSFCFHIYLAI